jgi:hypothetical protein
MGGFRLTKNCWAHPQVPSRAIYTGIFRKIIGFHVPGFARLKPARQVFADAPVRRSALLRYWCLLAEREGFEPSERLRAQRFSSSAILMLAYAVQRLSVFSSSPFQSRDPALSCSVPCYVARLVCKLVCRLPIQTLSQLEGKSGAMICWPRQDPPHPGPNHLPPTITRSVGPTVRILATMVLNKASQIGSRRGLERQNFPVFRGSNRAVAETQSPNSY